MKVGIVGTSGYAGGELLRLLVSHPQATVEYVASTSKVGEKVAEVLPAFHGIYDLVFEPVDAQAMARRCDVVFTATPHGVAMELAQELLDGGVVLIDIGSDFRFSDPRVYEAWYKQEHTRPQLAQEAVYGLVELFRDQVKEARLIANPGCYPTSALLALAPLAASGWIDLETVVITSMSGVSGAGATPKPMYHFPHCVENVQAYGYPGHRHTPEIEQGLSRFLGKEVPPITFSPHLVPMSRGILTHVSARSTVDIGPQDLINHYTEFYKDSPFVRVLAERLPDTKSVAGTNFCDLAPRLDHRARRIVVTSVIDNLVKGASGQAIQNMNVRFGLAETAGLWHPGFTP
ncbi:MAG TPA: N-acetyl-gamma-glutamyl-phosphate reductase [Limnochordia bacterium]|nr:N-acetyl-gamma-glutamyl-phosphate reductase [Limnochordia bacterium]